MPLKIMPLGDSITEGTAFPGGYRNALENMLGASGLSVDFVGSLSNGPSSLADKDHEGHGGSSIDTIANSVNGWLTRQQPDIITLMIGTNDMFDASAGSTAPNRISALIDQITNFLPNAQLLVGSIPPFTNPTINQRVLAFNSALPDIVSSKSAEGKNVTFVDISNKLTLSDIAKDGFHLTEEGYSKTAQAWDSAIRSLPTTTPDVPITNTAGNLFEMSDFNADNKSDILWRHSDTGINTVWMMDGTNVAQDVPITPVLDLNWSIGGTGDFNGDDKSDILWHHSATGMNTVWMMDGTNVVQDVPITPVVDPNWSIGGTGDFNGDNKSDILWRNSATGVNTVWMMDGTNVVQDIAITPVVDPNWSISGTGDFNSDDKSDIIWRNNATGVNAIWLMDGTNLVQYVHLTELPDLNWSMGGTGDFNSDNQSDILWRNTASGENIAWLMNGTTPTQYVAINQVSDLSWQIGS